MRGEGDQGIIILFRLAAAIVVIAMVFRHRRGQWQHLERIKAIESGAALPEYPLMGKRGYLLRGLLWLFGGTALTIFLLVGLEVVNTARPRPQLMVERMNQIAELRRQGVPEEDLKRLAAEPLGVGQSHPTPLALIGLVPIAVGLAYLVYYRSESA